MRPEERQKAILDSLIIHGPRNAAQLCEEIGASIATIRRDLCALADAGKILKSYGSARLPEPALDPVSPAPGPYYQAKQEIARTAARLVESGDSLFLGAGETCALLARNIADKENITVATTNVNAVLELAGSPNVSMLLLGGMVRIGSHFIETLDEYTAEQISKLHFSKVFLTVNGIDPDFGCSIHKRQQLPLYLHLMEHAEQFYIVADHGKFRQRTFAQLCPLEKVGYIITDSGVRAEDLRWLKENGVQVIAGEKEYP